MVVEPFALLSPFYAFSCDITCSILLILSLYIPRSFYHLYPSIIYYYSLQLMTILIT